MRLRTFNLSTLIFLLLWGLWLTQLSRFPASYVHDDAFRLAKGVEDFDLLNLTPHFPGYPGLVFGARLLLPLVDTAKTALHWFCLLFTSLLPLFVALLSRNPTNKLVVLAACLVHPASAGLALSMMSDGPGLALLFCALLLYTCERYTLSGFVLALSLTLRPSYLVLAAIFLVFLWTKAPNKPKLLVVLVLPLACSALVLWGLTGNLLWDEMFRFVSGHSQIWIQREPQGWLFGIGKMFGSLELLLALVGVLILPLLQYQRSRSPLLWMAMGYGFWIVVFQNSGNPRHLAPLVFLLFAESAFQGNQNKAAWMTRLVLLLTLAGIPVSAAQWSPQPSPLEQALNRVDQICPTLFFTNQGVLLSREMHPQINLADAFYQTEASGLINKDRDQEILRLSSSLLKGAKLLEAFPARFPTELPLYLYSITE